MIFSSLIDLRDDGRTVLGRRPLTGDPDDLHLLSTQGLLDLDQVGDRLAAGSTPGSPEVEQNQVGIEIVERDHLALDVGKPEVHKPPFVGVELASDFRTGRQGGQPRCGGGGELAGRFQRIRPRQLAPFDRGVAGAFWSDSSRGIGSFLKTSSPQVGRVGSVGAADRTGLGGRLALGSSRIASRLTWRAGRLALAMASGSLIKRGA